MNKLKMILTLAVAAAMTVSAFAQDPGPGVGARAKGEGKREGKAGGRMGGEFEKKIMEQLNLSEKQKAELKALIKKEGEARKAMMEKMRAGGAPPDRSKMQETMRQNREAHTAAIKKILTEAQFAKYQELVKAEMKKLRDGREGGAGKGKAGKAGKAGKGGSPA